MKVKICKLNEKAIVPVYSSKSAAGADLYNCNESLTVKPGETVMVGTGILQEAGLRASKGLLLQIRLVLLIAITVVKLRLLYIIIQTQSVWWKRESELLK